MQMVETFFDTKWKFFIRWVESRGVRIPDDMRDSRNALEIVIALYQRVDEGLIEQVRNQTLTRKLLLALLERTPLNEAATLLVASADAEAFAKLLLYIDCFVTCAEEVLREYQRAEDESAQNGNDERA